MPYLRSVNCEWGEKAGSEGRDLVQEKRWAPQKLAPQVVGTPKHTPQSPLSPTSILLPLTSPDPLSLPGPLRTSWDLRKPWEPLEALGLQWDTEALLSLLPLTPPHSLSLPLTPSHSLSLPRPPWVPRTFLGPQKALGAFASLWQPWVFSQTQGPCFPCSPSPPFALSRPLSLPEPP